MSKELFTNCKTCYFLGPFGCELELWESRGFKDKVLYEDGMTKIVGKICPYHRVPKWASIVSGPPGKAVKEEVQLKFGLVVTLEKDEDLDGIFDSILEITEGPFKPTKIYFIDDRPNNRDNTVKNKLDLIGVPFRLKKTVLKQPIENFIHEFVSSGSLKDPFYLCVKKPGFDLKFLENLHKIIYEDMLECIVFDKQDPYYFIPSQLHLFEKSNFQNLLTDQCRYTYDGVLKYS